MRTLGQHTPEELIERYQNVCRPVRDLLVDYLSGRQPSLDYTQYCSIRSRRLRRGHGRVGASCDACRV